MQTKDEKRLNKCLVNAQQMPLFAAFGIAIPFILIIAAPAGLLFLLQTKRFLNTVDRGEADLETEGPVGELTQRKLQFLRSHLFRFVLPSIVLALYFALIVAISIWATA